MNKPLGAVSERVDNHCRVVYDKDDNTGEDLSYILNKKTKKVSKLRRDGNVWKLDAIVASEMVMTEPGFSRPA